MLLSLSVKYSKASDKDIMLTAPNVVLFLLLQIFGLLEIKIRTVRTLCGKIFPVITGTSR